MNRWQTKWGPAAWGSAILAADQFSPVIVVSCTFPVEKWYELAAVCDLLIGDICHLFLSFSSTLISQIWVPRATHGLKHVP